MARLGDKRLWLFDVDNTLIRDIEHPDPFPDVFPLLEALQQRGATLGVLTNVGRLSSAQIHRALKRASFHFDADKIFSAGAAAAAYVYNRNRDARCFIISEGGARDDFVARGLEVTNNPPIDYVAVGADRGMTFQELNFAAKMVHEGAELICISGSRSYPGVYLGAEDVYIGELSIVAAIEDATGKKAVVVGKPLPEIFVETVKALGFSLDDAVMVGDNPNSDIAGGRAAGLTTVLVRRNPDNIIQFDSGGLDTTPDIVVDSLDQLVAKL
ncbi:MAG: hypothetical protein DRO93_02400 [Candidatus Thorarchaeota archaeon]|nr:MAG: hypothetical protein DRO93_02400 [Candidatus Thorarchaeota archaeon]